MLNAIAISATAPAITGPVAIFLMVLGIIVVTPMLLKPLKIPNVIGLILAGIIVGPYGFNLLARDMSFEVFGQVGILYLMFLAGIEIDMYNLKKNLTRGLVFGIYTFFIPLLMGAVAAWLFLRQDALSSVLLASMFASHTLIAYPIVSRFGLTKSPAVIIAIAGTIVAVVLALIVVASVSGIYQEGDFRVAGLLRLFGAFVVYCVGVIYLYPRITRWFFKKYNDPIAQFVYLLAMVFAAAVMAQSIGIEGVFGAFFSGLVLNRYIPSRSPLMTRIEFVGNAIFIPYFLIGVGMLINIRVVATSWNTLYVALVMSAVGMASKWIAAFVTQKTFGFSGVERSIMYQLSNAHTAVALAVVMIGYNLGIFDEDILNGTVIMILITCSVSSFGTERAAMRLKIRELDEDAATDTSRKSRRLVTNTLISVANPVTAPQLVDLALLMRGPERQGNRVYALHVRNDNSGPSRAIGRNSLDVAEQTASAADTRLIPIERYDLNIVTGLVNTIAERDITDVIIGLHRRSNVIDSFFGIKIEQLLKTSNRMVVMTRCFIPVNTVTRIVVWVPAQAQFETGFRRWVTALGNLAQQVGCRIIFCAPAATQRFIKSVYVNASMGLRCEFRDVESWDDFIAIADRVLDDDLFVVVSARRASVSFNSDMDRIPEFLQRYFSGSNLVVLYPEQFGKQGEDPVATMAEAMSTDIVGTPSPLLLKLRQLYNALRGK